MGSKVLFLLLVSVMVGLGVWFKREVICWGRTTGYELLGDLDAWQGDVQGAARAYTISFHATPKAPDSPMLKLARLYVSQQNPREAESTYKVILSIHPKQPDALAELASLYEQQGHLDLALNAYQGAYQSGKSNDPVLNLQLARLHQRLADVFPPADPQRAHQLSLAEKDLIHAQDLDRENPQYPFYLGLLYHGPLHDPIRAARAYCRSLKLDPQPVVRYDFAQTLGDLKLYEEASGQIRQAVEESAAPKSGTLQPEEITEAVAQAQRYQSNRVLEPDAKVPLSDLDNQLLSQCFLQHPQDHQTGSHQS